MQVGGEKISGEVAFHAGFHPPSTMVSEWPHSGVTISFFKIFCYCSVNFIGFQLQVKEVQKFGLHHVDAYDITKSDL